jgi:hypothetical protein
MAKLTTTQSWAVLFAVFAVLFILTILNPKASDTGVAILFFVAIFSLFMTIGHAIDGAVHGEKFTIAKEVGMPLDTQASGHNADSPILGSEPKPITLKPYEDMVIDETIAQYKTNEKGAHCCPSPITSSEGCVCLSDKDIDELSSRGGNRLSE